MNNFGSEHRKQLENEFQQAFENAQLSPPAHIWEEIDAALETPQKWYRRPAAYWSAGLVAALLLIAAFWLTLPSEKTTPQEKTVQHTETTITQNDNSKNEVEIAKTPLAENLSSSSLESNSNIGSNSSSKSTNNLSADYTANTPSRKHIRDTPSLAEYNTNTSANSIDEITVVGNADENSGLPVVLQPSDLYLLDLANPIVGIAVVPLEEQTNDFSHSKENEATENQDNKKALFVILGVNYSQGVYQPRFRSDSSYRPLVEGARQTNLSDTLPQSNINGNYSRLGFDVGIQLGNHWSLNTGLGFNSTSFEFATNNSYILVSDFQAPTLVEVPNVQVRVESQSLQVPIALGYQFGETRAKNITGFAQLGLGLEWIQSYTYASSVDRFGYSLGEQQAFNTQLWTQVGLSYHLTDRLSIWGGGLYQSSLSAPIQAEGLSMSTQNFGWQTGIRFVAFKKKK